MATMTKSNAIELRGVVKRFGAVTAVDGLDLDVPEGTCVGLLGPNGAGKSTTMKLLTAQAIADEGTLEVLGLRLPDESKQARALMGVAPQLDNLDTTLTVEQNLLVFSFLYRIPRAQRREAIDRALAIANLRERRGAKVDELRAVHERARDEQPPARLREVEEDAGRRGWATRRTGTSVTILRAESLNGDAPEGERRPANLEDVFVLLTGEEAE